MSARAPSEEAVNNVWCTERDNPQSAFVSILDETEMERWAGYTRPVLSPAGFRCPAKRYIRGEIRHLCDGGGQLPGLHFTGRSDFDAHIQNEHGDDYRILEAKVNAHNWFTLYTAWRKRAEEAEAVLAAYAVDFPSPPVVSGERERLAQNIEDAMLAYRCLHLRDEEGNGQQLVDALTTGDTIAEGQEELSELAGEIADALRGVGLRPEHQSGRNAALEEAAWLIERRMPFGTDPQTPSMTSLWWDGEEWHGADTAVRFARKEDAQKVIDASTRVACIDNYRAFVTEHTWMTPNSPSSGAEP